MTMSKSGLVFQTAVLTSTKMFCRHNGVIRDMGKYPFARILIGFAYVMVYAQGQNRQSIEIV